jgi:hypothetical protein
MRPETYGIAALLLGVAAILTAFFKRPINKALTHPMDKYLSKLAKRQAEKPPTATEFRH